MARIETLVRRGRASRKTGFATPIISTPAEALDAARALGEALGQLPEPQRMVLLSDLSVLSLDLSRRIDRLEADLAAAREELKRVRLSGRVCRLYAEVDRHGGPPGARTSCP